MSEESKIVNLWVELLQQVTELQPDLEKNALKSNVSAGLRVRKKLRMIRSQVMLILSEILETDKALMSNRKEKNAASAKEPKVSED